MKVIYFTFLVLFFTFYLEANAEEKCIPLCSAGGTQVMDNSCFTACMARNRAATTTSPQSVAPATKRQVSSSPKSPSKKAAPSSDNSGLDNSQVSSDPVPEFSCPQNQYRLVKRVGNVVTSNDCVPCAPDSDIAECRRNSNGNDSQSVSERERCEADSSKSWICPEEGEGACSCQNKLNDVSSTQNANCESEFNNQWARCTQESESAMTSCNDNNEEMQAAENTAKLIGAGSVTSMQIACSKIGELSKLANGALSGWKALCSTNQGGCTESCTEAKRIINECMQGQTRTDYSNGYIHLLNQKINTCESYKTKIAQATQHAAAALAQLKASEQCKNDTSSLVNNAVDQCKANPNSPLCKDLQKCSDANFAAQNPVCACASNPTSPSCLQASANYGSGAKSTGATLPGVNGGKDTSGLPGLNGAGNGDGQNITGLGTNASPATDGHGVGGRQGDASSAGNLKNNAAGGPNAGGNHYGAGGGKDPLKVNSGTLGGIPGGPGYFGRSPTSGGGYGANAINGNKGTLGKFDPRKYITGLGGKGEYINGANQNIFMIVKMRYEDKKTSLLPETFNLKK